jgi:hypothetical protein
MYRGQSLAIEGHAQGDDFVSADAFRKAKPSHKETQLHRNHHETPIDGDGHGIDPMRHAPFDHSLCELQKWSVGAACRDGQVLRKTVSIQTLAGL